MNRKETYNRVKQAFKKLRKHGLICRMNYLCCMTCASSDLGTKCDEREKDGAVYFHKQDYENFWSDYSYLEKRNLQDEDTPIHRNLHIRYFHKEDGRTVEVGRLVQEVLMTEGLHIEWNGDADQTITVVSEVGAQVKQFGLGSQLVERS